MYRAKGNIKGRNNEHKQKQQRKKEAREAERLKNEYDLQQPGTRIDWMGRPFRPGS